MDLSQAYVNFILDLYRGATVNDPRDGTPTELFLHGLPMAGIRRVSLGEVVTEAQMAGVVGGVVGTLANMANASGNSILEVLNVLSTLCNLDDLRTEEKAVGAFIGANQMVDIKRDLQDAIRGHVCAYIDVPVVGCKLRLQDVADALKGGFAALAANTSAADPPDWREDRMAFLEGLGKRSGSVRSNRRQSKRRGGGV